MTELVITRRNMSIIAHIDAGKSTLSDALCCMGGLMSFDDVGVRRITDGMKEEQDKGITIKSTGVSINFKHDTQSVDVNIIDTPGHSDFSSNVSAALRISDGCFVVLDSVSGIETQTITVLRQALQERVKPVLVINKFDRLIFELQLEPEEIYQRLEKMIDDVNCLIQEEEENKWVTPLNPSTGNVIFTSAYHNWGFNLQTFADFYATKNKNNNDNMTKLLWGDYYLDDKGLITTKPNNKRMFCEYICKPLCNLAIKIKNGDTTYTKALNRLGLELLPNESSLEGKELYKKLFRRIFPLTKVLKYIIYTHLPSPQEAQIYRVDVLYNGPKGDDAYNAIKNCDVNGPVIFYTSLMTPSDGSRFNAFGRLFSGTMTQGLRVNVCGSNYEPGKNVDLHKNKSVQRIIRVCGKNSENIDSATAGDIFAVAGIDGVLKKTGTLTTVSENIYPIKTAKFVVSPVVQMAIRAKNSVDIPKLVDGMRQLSKSDPILECTHNESGENILACVGELHLEMSICELKRMCGIEIVLSEPLVPFRETITLESQTCLSKSANKHNRIYIKAIPMQTELIEKLENGEINVRGDFVELAKQLEPYDIPSDKIRRIWGFAPEIKPSNIFIDNTFGQAYMSEIKDSVKSGFMHACNNGIICNEQIRGVIFYLEDVVLHADAIHRGMGQIMPATRNAIYACMLTGTPTIYEPIYEVNINTTSEKKGKVYSLISNKRGQILSEETNIHNGMVELNGTLPVVESFGFDSKLKEITSGEAFPQLSFKCWNLINKNEEEGKLREIRTRKGLKEPLLENYLDKL